MMTAATPSAGADESDAFPPPDDVLDTLVETRPRVIVTAADFARAGRLIETDPVAKRWFAGLREDAADMVDEPLPEHELRDGKRMLFVSREVLKRTQTLAVVYRLSDDDAERQRCLDRVWAEMRAVAAFPDWNPGHFLDTAEMCTAVAIAYDWLYDAWTDEQRALVRSAMLKHALRVAERAYGLTGDKPAWWTNVHHNWNQVCNGGIAMGALALAEHEPQLAGRLVHAAVTRLPKAMAEYAPDGGYPEGPMYWAYGTRYNVWLLATLGAALGTGFGLSEAEGFAATGSFPLQMLGPSGQTFNFADAGGGRGGDPVLLWLAGEFDQPGWAWERVRQHQGTPLDLLWYRPSELGDPPAEGEVHPAPMPLDALYKRVGAVAMRSGRGGDAMFVAVTAGSQRFNHGQLDAGSFVLDFAGVRFIEELGPDNYNLPDYFGGKRWTYYRLRAEGHNTLVTPPTDAGWDQDPRHAAAITAWDPGEKRAAVALDLSKTYPAAKRAVRTIGLDRSGGGAVTCRDEIERDAAGDVWWFAHTRADVELSEDGRIAVLTRGGKRLKAALLKPDEARFEVRDASPLPGSPDPERQADNDGYRKLTVHVEDVEETEIRVRFEPVGEE